MPATPTRRAFARPLADLASETIAPALRKAGFAATEVVTRWDEIVGPELAARSNPTKIAWARRRGREPAPDEPPEPGTLHVVVEAPFALEVQHATPIIVERVNAFFGWRCVSAVRLTQTPMKRPKPKPRPRPRPPVDETRLAEAVDGIVDEQLKSALERLGRAVGRG